MGFGEAKAPSSLARCKREHFSVRTLYLLRVVRLSPPHSPSCQDQVGRRNDWIDRANLGPLDTPLGLGEHL